jgi:hypothetical protein
MAPRSACASAFPCSANGRNGVPAFAGAIPPVDAPVVERMRAAGAIPIGRTNLPDMGLRMHTDSSLHGLTRNPWNPVRTASGSSGGDAVALAALRVRVELARSHVFDHTLTQWTDGVGLAHRALLPE